MTLNPKLLIGLLMFLVVAGMICSIADGAWVDTSQIEAMQGAAGVGASTASITNFVETIKQIVTWDYSFFHTEIGMYVRWFMLLLSGGIFLVLAFDLVRLILPWKA